MSQKDSTSTETEKESEGLKGQCHNRDQESRTVQKDEGKGKGDSVTIGPRTVHALKQKEKGRD